MKDIQYRVVDALSDDEPSALRIGAFEHDRLVAWTCARANDSDAKR